MGSCAPVSAVARSPETRRHPCVKPPGSIVQAVRRWVSGVRASRRQRAFVRPVSPPAGAVWSQLVRAGWWSLGGRVEAVGAHGKFRRRARRTNDIQIHFSRAYGSGLPVVLLHGLMGSGTCWSPLARRSRMSSTSSCLTPEATAARLHRTSDTATTSSPARTVAHRRRRRTGNPAMGPLVQHERLYTALGDIPPTEFETAQYAQTSTSQLVETQ
ncbi:MAG: hypothetical protein JWL72_3766 [Ilumatobacteraceae bacterium]|nr:hypothetical protein [Ilumatobacteraceae bacterium]